MSRTTPFLARPMVPWDRTEALELASAVGVPGIYVANWLASAEGADDDAEVLVLAGEERFVGLCFFGARGNLVVLEREVLDAAGVAEAVIRSRWGWRIVLARQEIVHALAVREAAPPLVEREQVWYGVVPSRVDRTRVRDDVRVASEADLSALMECALQLNHSDLRVEPRRVNKSWLEAMLHRRIRDGSTRIVGAAGRVECKLDLGSAGPYGLVLEGVFTVAAARGRGYASGLVATVAHEAGPDVPLVCLHVAASNVVARRAYERAGMREVARCGILLRG